MKNQTILKSILFSLFVFLLFVSIYDCQKPSKKQTDNKIESETELAPEGGGTLVIAYPTEISDLNPLTANAIYDLDIIAQIYLSLADRDEKLNIVPLLAESWEFSPNFLSLTYRLRKDIVWSDNTPFTADDVVYTYRLFTNPDVNFKDITYLELIDKVEAIDKYTVRFTFKEVYSDELDNSGGFVILPKHIFEKINLKEIKSANVRYNPVGCGPFKLEKWDRGTQWSLIPNELYYKGRANLDKIIYRPIPDENTRLTSVKTGEVDLVERISPQYYNELKNQQNLNIILRQEPAFMYIGWNLNNPLFQSKRVRYALSSAIDVDEMINKYLYGLGERVTGSILKIHWAYKEITPIPYNIDTAKSILASEGWVDTNGDGWIDKNGKKFSFSIITNPTRMNVVTYIQSQFAKLGIEVIPKPLEWNVSQTEIYSRRFDAYYGGWRMPFIVNPKQAWHSSEADRKESLNYISYRNATVDSLIDIGIKTLDKKKAIEIWGKFQQIIYDEQPYTFLYSPLSVNAVNKRVRNVKADVRGMYINLDEWWIPIKQRRKL